MRPRHDSWTKVMTRVPELTPDLRTSAFLFDVDGTLVDIAPTPREVHVPPTLRHALMRLVAATDGAVALVSGRPISDLDRLFDPLRLTSIGGHGAEFRLLHGGEIEKCNTPTLGPELKRRLRGLAGSGVLAEDKGYAVALHYRLAPEKEEWVRESVAKICSEPWPVVLEILPGKAVVEIKAAGFSKGTAVRELMKQPPFRDRTPIFVGDDTTDETVFAVMPDFAGHAFSVGRQVQGAENHFDCPADVREWLEHIAPAVERSAR